MNRLRKAVQDYLTLRRSLGFKIQSAHDLLPDFASFIEGKGAQHITTEHALEWAKRTKCGNPARWAKRLTPVRVFARHWSAVDPRTEVPPDRLLPHEYPRRSPYIFTDAAIRRLMDATRHLREARALGQSTYSAFLGLLASTGIRSGEARALDRDDVDLAQGLMLIRSGKFGKSRLVPLHATACKALREYAKRRDTFAQSAKTPAFFVLHRGTRVRTGTLQWVFRKLVGLAGLESVRPRPLLSSLRHTFAVRTLIRWYRAGVDVERQMLLLSTYLGHCHLRYTYWYLSAVPELLALAGSRLESTLGDLP